MIVACVEEGLNSYCVAPLMIGGKSIGTLNLASQKTNQYSEADAEFLCELGSQVALAVSNMTSYRGDRRAQQSGWNTRRSAIARCWGLTTRSSPT